MKNRLNILCILVFLVFCLSAYKTGNYLLFGLQNGIETIESDDLGISKSMTSVSIVPLMPKKMYNFTDSIQNMKTGKYIPIKHLELYADLSSKDTNESYNNFIPSMLVILSLIFLILAFYVFVRFVFTINRSRIFNWINVKRLRKIGIYFLLAYACLFISAYIETQFILSHLELEHYTIKAFDSLPQTNLIIGLISLVFAEVFAIGLKLQEEQELTI